MNKTEREILASRRGWNVGVEFKLQDLWVGMYWKRIGNSVDLWICFVPCLPIHVSWWWSGEPLY